MTLMSTPRLDQKLSLHYWSRMALTDSLLPLLKQAEGVRQGERDRGFRGLP